MNILKSIQQLHTITRNEITKEDLVICVEALSSINSEIITFVFLPDEKLQADPHKAREAEKNYKKIIQQLEQEEKEADEEEKEYRENAKLLDEMNKAYYNLHDKLKSETYKGEKMGGGLMSKHEIFGTPPPPKLNALEKVLVERHNATIKKQIEEWKRENQEQEQILTDRMNNASFSLKRENIKKTKVKERNIYEEATKPETNLNIARNEVIKKIEYEIRSTIKSAGTTPDEARNKMSEERTNLTAIIKATSKTQFTYAQQNRAIAHIKLLTNSLVGLDNAINKGQEQHTDIQTIAMIRAFALLGISMRDLTEIKDYPLTKIATLISDYAIFYILE